MHGDDKYHSLFVSQWENLEACSTIFQSSPAECSPITHSSDLLSNNTPYVGWKPTSLSHSPTGTFSDCIPSYSHQILLKVCFWGGCPMNTGHVTYWVEIAKSKKKEKGTEQFTGLIQNGAQASVVRSTAVGSHPEQCTKSLIHLNITWRLYYKKWICSCLQNIQGFMGALKSMIKWIKATYL